jgi:hypothetical protein
VYHSYPPTRLTRFAVAQRWQIRGPADLAHRAVQGARLFSAILGLIVLSAFLYFLCLAHLVCKVVPWPKDKFGR